MRLINTRTLKLQEFPDNRDIPPYAIASHCWGDDEATFQDFLKNRGRKKAGRGKVVQFCQTAMTLGHQWLWIDTCCIDKTNSAELMEAINSMFSWYAQRSRQADISWATTCLVYLADVPGPEATDGALRDSRWFTRSWTLPELIAPNDVQFYNSAWEPIGNKKDMASLLQAITGIPQTVLKNPASLRSVTKKARLTWAEHRQSSRVEDRAYSLLGLCGVFLPLIYGEGEEAMYRLKEAIRMAEHHSQSKVDDTTQDDPAQHSRVSSPDSDVDSSAMPEASSDHRTASPTWSDRARDDEPDELLESEQQNFVDSYYSATGNERISDVPTNTLEDPIDGDVSSLGPATDSRCHSNNSSNAKPSDPDEFDDTASIRSDNRRVEMPANTKQYLAGLIADELKDNMANLRGRGLAHAQESVSEMLKDFSMLTMIRATRDYEQEAATFVRHQRNNIGRYLDEGLKLSANELGNPTSSDRIAILWNRQINIGEMNPEPFDVPADLSDANAIENDDHPVPKNVPLARKFITEGAEFLWLLNRLRHMESVGPPGDTELLIRRQLLERISEIPFDGMKQEVTIHLAWSPREFITAQEYSTQDLLLHNVIAMCRQAGNVCAATCEDYIDRTWPTLGTHVLNIVQTVCNRMECRRTIHAGPIIDMRLHQGELLVEISAQPIEALEICEVLVWLGTVCRSARSGAVHGAICIAKPNVVLKHDSDKINIDWETHMQTMPESDTCWLAMFRNAVIADDYSVPARENDEKGVEMSIPMMVCLSRASYGTVVSNMLVIKGIISALVPLVNLGSSIVWHFLLKQDHSHLTFGDILSLSSAATTLDMSCLEDKRRHFVGWTPSADQMAGTANATYVLASSKLTDLQPSMFAVTGLSLGGGKFLNASVTIAAGKRETPKAFEVEPYEMVIRTARQWGIVFYGAVDRRAWLVDGETALLHLSMNWLSSDYASDAESTALDGFTFASRETNINPHKALIANRNIRLFGSEEVKTKRVVDLATSKETETEERTTTWWTYEKLIMMIWHNLDKAHGYLHAPRSTLFEANLQRLKENVRGKDILLGFNVHDIISGGRPQPLVAALHRSASPWQEFATQIGTINLFADTFGDLVVPSKEPNDRLRVHTCARHSSVPCDNDYLVVPFSTLRNVSTRHFRSLGTRTVRLTETLFWTESAETLGRCNCNDSASPCSPVLSTLQSNVHHSMRQTDMDSVLQRHPAGAIIIGAARHHGSDRSTTSSMIDSAVDMRSPESSAASTSNATASPMSQSESSQRVGLGRRIAQRLRLLRSGSANAKPGTFS